MHLLTEEEGICALQTARAFVEAAVRGKAVTRQDIPEVFREKRGVFVTLSEFGELRGCIGYPYPILSLGEALQEAAVSAALRDPRFYPVREAELADIRLEVTILTAPVPLDCPAEERAGQVIVGRHGLIAEDAGKTGLLLPQVATEYGWDSVTFLNQTCIKAGLAASAWKRDSCRIQTFEGQIFSETE